jgi:hypothetical protein
MNVFVVCRGTAVTLKNMLQIAFPGIEVFLANYPPPLPKRLLSKVVPVVQIGVIGVVVAGEQIFPMLGFVAPPPWYYSLRGNRFGTIATTWLLGNALQSFLQSSGAFEVYFNGDLVGAFLLSFSFLYIYIVVNTFELILIPSNSSVIIGIL